MGDFNIRPFLERDSILYVLQVLKIELFCLTLNVQSKLRVINSLFPRFPILLFFSLASSFLKLDFSFNFNLLQYFHSPPSILTPFLFLSILVSHPSAPAGRAQLEAYCNEKFTFLARAYVHNIVTAQKSTPSRHFILPRNRRNYRIELHAYTYMCACFASKSCYSCLYSCDQPLHFLFPVFLTNRVSRLVKLKCLQGCGHAGYACELTIR